LKKVQYIRNAFKLKAMGAANARRQPQTRGTYRFIRGWDGAAP